MMIYQAKNKRHYIKNTITQFMIIHYK